jgi:Fe-S-cluster-containing dehydrogenase component
VVRQPERLAAGAPAGLAPALATRAGAATAGAGGLTSDGALTGDEQAAVERWVRAVARDLHEYPGRSIIMAGERQTAWCTRVAQALNALLGNVGRTVRYTEPVLADAGGAGGPAELSALVAEMRAGVVDTLVVLEGNPVYDSPADLEFANALSRVRRTVYLGLYENETAAVCDWFIPALHYLERWGDSRAWDGTAAIIQPLIRPLYDGRSADDVLATFAGLTGTTTYDLLRQLWMQQTGPPEFDAFWEDALRRGVVSGTESAPLELQPQWDALNLLLADLEPARIGGVPAIAAEPGTRPPTAAPQSAPSATTAAPVLPSGTAAAPEAAVPSGTATGTAPSDGPTRASPDGAVELAFLQSASVYDGRFANNAWLQELPDPLTKLTWDNAAVVSPRTAARLGLEAERVVELRLQGRQLTAPVFILPGQADDLVTLALGYGRRGTEAVARGVGANAYTLRTTEAPYFAAGVTLTPLSTRQSLATTQTHWTMAGRPIVLSATLDEYRADPEFTRQHRGPVLSLYRPFEYDRGDQWSMAIDLATCIGCNACVVACQAENNIPVVGKGGVLKSREMHWLRIDRYFDGTAEEPGVVFQPMLCQHCEKAPCEYVCPVNATVHSPDGLNEMIYNRCVGTRFCSNNCPYKVRRFNWLDYNAGKPETLDMAMNPDVTVRARGVMEKCTFCVQRIRRAQQQAAVEGRRLQPGEVRTACQQACSTQAIWFGSYTDPDEELLRRLSEPRRYAVLNELGTEPRVKYLARITNPGGDLEGVYAQPPAASPPTSPGYAPGGAPGAGQR